MPKYTGYNGAFKYVYICIYKYVHMYIHIYTYIYIGYNGAFKYKGWRMGIKTRGYFCRT
jgi:hypothetical protein